MPHVDLTGIKFGTRHTRKELARVWRYDSYHAIARGVVTPSGDNKIILFVTERKKSDREPYADTLAGRLLHWEGPTDHFAEDRMANAASTGDAIHVFYRYLPDDRFAYLGQAEVIDYKRRADRPSKFILKVERGFNEL
jgi:putative restriction endonuclease